MLDILILSYFDVIVGPRVFLQTPESISDEILKHIPLLLNIYDKGFFVSITGDYKSANFIFNLPSDYARGKQETFLISFVIDINYNINLNLSEELLIVFADQLKNIKDGFKACYLDSTKFVGDESKFEEIKDIFQKFYQHLRRTLKALEEAEIRYRHLFEHSPFSITILDKSGKIVDINSANERLFGYGKEDLIGKYRWKKFPPEKLHMLIDKFKEILKGEVPKPLEIQIIKKNGELVWVNITYSLINIGTEKLIMVISQDIDKSKKAEQELKESEDKFRKLSTAARDGIIIIDDFGKIKFWNAGAERIFDYTENEILGKSVFTSLLTGRYQGLRESDLEKFRTTGKDLLIDRTFELTGRKKDGSEIPIEISISSVKIKDKWNAIAIIRDISKKKKAEQKLLESEEKYRGILENIKEGYFEVDLKGNLTFFNKGFCEILGYSREELLNVHFSNLMDEDNKQNAYNQFNKIYKTEVGLPDFQHEVIKKDGTKRFVESSGYLRNDSNGKKIGFYGIFRDITEKKEAEQKLKESEEKLKKVNSILNGINRIFELVIMGKTEEEIAKNCLAIVEDITESKFGFIGELNQEGRFDTIAISNPGWDACKMPESKATKSILNMELRGLWSIILKKEKSYIINEPASHPASVGIPKGHPRITSFLGVPLKHEKKTIGMIALANKASGYDYDDQKAVEAISDAIVDALKRKRAEDKLKQSDEKLKELNIKLEQKIKERTRELQEALEQQKLYLDQILKTSQFKTEFMASISHDLRTPLNAISGFTDLLLEGSYGPLDETQRGFLMDIKISSTYLIEMINHLLDISKIEAGQLKLNIQEFSLNIIIKQIESTIRPLYSEKGLKFKVKGLDNEKEMYADPTRFTEILYNLLSNAIKYTKQGSITLEVLDNENQWIFNVIDTGIGIPEKDYDAIFKEFIRGDSHFVQATSGTGLGLALTKHLVDLHNGDIYFKSELGKGSKFTFTIPKNLKKISL